MVDSNDFDIQRRNLMLINVVVFLLNITTIDIKNFKVFNIPFEINESFLIGNFNILFLIVWIYINIRYISILFDNNGVVSELSDFNSGTSFKKRESKDAYINKPISIQFIYEFYRVYRIAFFNFIILLSKLFFSLLHRKYINVLIPIYFTLGNMLYIAFYKNQPIVLFLLLLFMMVFAANEKESIRFKKKENKFKQKYDNYKKNKLLR